MGSRAAHAAGAITLAAVFQHAFIANKPSDFHSSWRQRLSDLGSTVSDGYLTVGRRRVIVSIDH